MSTDSSERVEREPVVHMHPFLQTIAILHLKESFETKATKQYLGVFLCTHQADVSHYQNLIIITI